MTKIIKEKDKEIKDKIKDKDKEIKLSINEIVRLAKIIKKKCLQPEPCKNNCSVCKAKKKTWEMYRDAIHNTERLFLFKEKLQRKALKEA